MKIELQSTGRIVLLDGVPCRVWEGKTAAGVPLTAYIARVAIDDPRDASHFARELLETPRPELVEVNVGN